ncbi:MAG TPA: hypothetical protein VKT21_00390 [Thermoplasmata archaeon]|nr:hypothetical protein [Thermoplasmata archaeon]
MARAARAVRIRRDPGGSVAEESPLIQKRLAAPVQRFTNSDGTSRAFVMFLFFVVLLVAIYGVFLSVALRSSVDGAGTGVEVVLTVSAGAALAVGWWVTLGQAPAMAWIQNGQLVVRERTGRSSRFPTDTLRVQRLRSNGGGIFGKAPTEFVELSSPGRARRTYLVGAHFFDFAQ